MTLTSPSDQPDRALAAEATIAEDAVALAGEPVAAEAVDAATTGAEPTRRASWAATPACSAPCSAWPPSPVR